MAMSWGRSASAGAATMNAPSVKQGGAARLQTAAIAEEEDRPENDAHQGRPQDGKSTPAAHLIRGIEQHLGAPLLVEPREPGGSERPGIDGRDRPR